MADPSTRSPQPRSRRKSGQALALLALACFTLSACDNAAQKKYKADVACAANERARHEYIDQTPEVIRIADVDGNRERMRLLYARAEHSGRALQVSRERVDGEIVSEGKALQEKLFAKGIVEGAVVMEAKARSCLKFVGEPKSSPVTNSADAVAFLGSPQRRFR